MGSENWWGVGIFFVGDFDQISDRTTTFLRLCAVNAEDGAVSDSVAELDLVHGYGDELAVGKIQ